MRRKRILRYTGQHLDEATARENAATWGEWLGEDAIVVVRRPTKNIRLWRWFVYQPVQYPEQMYRGNR